MMTAGKNSSEKLPPIHGRSVSVASVATATVTRARLYAAAGRRLSGTMTTVAAIIPAMRKKLLVALLAVALSPSLLAQQKQKTPRTPWGDPDFSGNYTNLYEAGTPMERPAQFDGKKLGDVTPEELK